MSVDSELDRFLAGVERRAFRHAELALRDVDEALDVVQDAMVALVARYRSRPADEWPPLFWRILTTRIADAHRRRQRNRRRFGFLPPLRDASDGGDGDSRGGAGEGGEDELERVAADPATSPDVRLESADLSERILAAVRRLPLRQQQAFLLRSWQGLSVADTARAMGCGENSVKTHTARALTQLRSWLGDLHE